MCCLSSAQGKRQHLAVSHEKGKITILQLSALLKQADSSTRKLTLTRLATAPIPFTVLSLTSNLANEDFLAVCGLKDCHILTFNSSGSVSEHLVLHPQLETGNFIIKAIWLPGSQTQLALVTADFVKIFDLSKDALSPQYYFLVPSGKIRDCTFMYGDGTYNILLMSSPGHIYIETLNEGSSAKHGAFYVTNTLEVFHLDVFVSSSSFSYNFVIIAINSFLLKNIKYYVLIFLLMKMNFRMSTARLLEVVLAFIILIFWDCYSIAMDKGKASYPLLLQRAQN